MADVNNGNNGVKADIANLKSSFLNLHGDIDKLEDRVHGLELHGCAHKKNHDRALEEIWATLNEHRREADKRMQKHEDKLDKVGQTVAKWAGMAGVAIAIFYIILTHFIRTL